MDEISLSYIPLAC